MFQVDKTGYFVYSDDIITFTEWTCSRLFNTVPSLPTQVDGCFV